MVAQSKRPGGWGRQLWGHIPFPFLFSLATLGKVSRGPAPFPQMQNGELSVASGGRMIFRQDNVDEGARVSTDCGHSGYEIVVSSDQFNNYFLSVQ